MTENKYIYKWLFINKSNNFCQNEYLFNSAVACPVVFQEIRIMKHLDRKVNINLGSLKNPV